MGTIIKHDLDHLGYTRRSGQNVDDPANHRAEAVVFVRINSSTTPSASFQFTPGFQHIKKITLVRVLTQDGALGARSIDIKNGRGESIFPFNRVAADAAPRQPLYPVNTELDLPLVMYRDANGTLEGHITVDQYDFAGAPVADSKVCIVLRLDLASWQ
jgi:hypothetical protein